MIFSLKKSFGYKNKVENRGCNIKLRESWHILHVKNINYATLGYYTKLLDKYNIVLESFMHVLVYEVWRIIPLIIQTEKSSGYSFIKALTKNVKLHNNVGSL